MIYGGKPVEPELEIELEVDPEWLKIRRMREGAYKRAGIGEFTAYRLALVPDLDWHKVVAAAEGGAGDGMLIDLFLD